eukprot:15099296-Alexandrium_andersonii.AAC.1
MLVLHAVRIGESIATSTIATGPAPPGSHTHAGHVERAGGQTAPSEAGQGPERKIDAMHKRAAQ